MPGDDVVRISRKNGKIEFLRFIFCMAVLLFHCEKYVMGEPPCNEGYNLSLFCHGSMGVEFFFLVSGALMAKSAYKKMISEEKETFSKECLNFLKRKYFAIFPMHVIAFVITFVVFVVCERMNMLEIIAYAVQSIPNLFLIQMTGINISNPNHVTWYLSCMFIAMAILYPICRKYYYMFMHYWAPIISFLLLGYCTATTGTLTGVMQWTGLAYKSLFRALCEIALGTTAYEISRYFSRKDCTKGMRIKYAIGELVVFCCVMTYCIGTFPKKWEVIELFAILILVVLAFSEISYGSAFFNQSFFYHLGTLSLPLYLGQVSAIYVVTVFFSSWLYSRQILLIVVLTFMIAYFLLGANKLIYCIRIRYNRVGR